MNFAFSKHNYDLDNFERCPRDSAPLMVVAQDAEPVCLLEWVVKNSEDRKVRDVIERDRGRYDLPAVILDNGFMLPVRAAVDVTTSRPGEVNASVVGWRATDILFLRGETLAVELLPDGMEVDEDPGFLLCLDTQILLYLLFDAEIRKYEP